MRSLSYRVPTASASRNSSAADSWADGLSREELQAELEAWAAAIIRSGIGGAVPLPERNKYPNPSGFQGEKNDRSKCDSLAAVRRFIRNGFQVYDPPGTKNLVHHDTGSLGIRMADGVMGLDVDNWGGKQGARQLADLEAKWGKLPPTYYLTSRGPDQPSRILLLRATPGRKYVANAAGDIEVIQPHHRYAVAPPSVHPEGRPYSLHQPDGWPLPWPDEMPDVSELPQLPATWDDGLAAGASSDNGTPVTYDEAVKLLRAVGSEDICYQTEKVTDLWVERQDAGEPWESDGAKFSGYRTARAGAWALINDCAVGHEGAWHALAEIRDAYSRAEAGKKSQAVLDDNWRRIVTEGIGKVSLNGDRPPDKRKCENNARPDNAALLAGVKNGTWLDKQTFPALKYAIPDVLPEGVTLLTGPPKIGKSTLARQITLEAARGGKVFGIRCPQRDVLYIALEDDDPSMQASCWELLGDDQIPKQFSYITEIEPGKMINTVDAWLDSHPGGHAVVDTLGRALERPQKGETIYDRDYRILTNLKSVAKRHPGSAIVVTHHTNKGKSDDFVNMVSGTNALAGGADTIVVLKRQRGSTEGVWHLTSRKPIDDAEYALILERPIGWRLDGADLLEAAGQSVSRRSALGDRSKAVIEAVNDHPNGVTIKMVADATGLTQKDATNISTHGLEARRHRESRTRYLRTSKEAPRG